MKKVPFAIAALLFIGLQVKAQKEVLFKMKYLPSHTYTSVMKMDMNMEMNITGDTAIVNQLKKSGQKFPIIMQMQSTTNMDVKAGTVAKNSFPLSMTIQPVSSKMKMNGVEQTQPNVDAKQNIYAECNVDGKISMDSVGGKQMDAELKQQLAKTLDMMQNNINFPDKPMKVGDTFTQSVPMNMPMAGSTSEMLVKGTYKLTGIQKNQAYFDIDYTITMDLTGDKTTMDMTGGGKGKFIYDIANNFSTMVQENMDVNYTMVLPQMPASMKMTGKMNMLMDYTTNISAY